MFRARIQHLAVLAALAIALAVPASAVVARSNPDLVVSIQNANATFFAVIDEGTCDVSSMTLTVAQGYEHPPVTGFFQWADVYVSRWTGCESQVRMDSYGRVDLASSDYDFVDLDAGWVTKTITIEPGGRTIAFDLAWVASTKPQTTVNDRPDTLGSSGRYVEAHLTGTVVDSDGVFTREGLEVASLSDVLVRQ